MSLQLALLLIGVVVVALVALTAYDRRRLARAVRRGFGLSPAAAVPARREPLMRPESGPPTAAAPSAEGPRKYLRTEPEPAFVPPAPAPKAPDPLAHQLEDLEALANRPLNLNPGFDPPGTGLEAARQLGVQVEPNEAIDFIIHLPGPGPVTRRTALAVYKQNEYQLELPRQLYGRRYQTSFWSVVQTDSEATQYSDLKLAVQLIDARGPIDESQLNTFVQVGLKLADALHRPTKLSRPFEEALAQARRLAQFYDEHDVVAGVNVIAEPHAYFKGRAVQNALERAGLGLGVKHLYEKRADDEVLFRVARTGTPGDFKGVDWDALRVEGLALQMNVPRVPNPAAAFDAMIESARELCGFLGATLVDQDRRPLTESGIRAIRTQIQGIDSRMRAFGIAPGSEAARRLFAAD
jgi:hypothetical protein